MIRSFFLSFLLLTGCAKDKVFIDEDFTSHEVEMIELTVKEWLKATDNSETARLLMVHGLATPNRFSDSDWGGGFDSPAIYKIKSSDPGYDDLRARLNSPTTAGAATEGWRIVLVSDVLDDSVHSTYDEMFRATLLHELGHFYGLHHTDEGLMRASTNGVDVCIDEQTVLTFCNLHQDCGPLAHSTCSNKH